MPDYSNLDTVLPKGEHTVEVKLRSIITIEKGESITVGQAIDIARQETGSLVDWSVDDD
jgi:hypothetical protein